VNKEKLLRMLRVSIDELIKEAEPDAAKVLKELSDSDLDVEEIKQALKKLRERNDDKALAWEAKYILFYF